MIEEKKKRKKRSDKKVDCKPTIPVNLKECIYRISYITKTPVKDVAEEICHTGLESKIVMENLSKFFRRDFQVGNTFFMGDLERISLQRARSKDQTERITIRFNQNTYERICALGYALDVTPSKATALLLEASVKTTRFIDRFTKEYLKENMDSGRLRELRKVIKYLNANNPYEEEISWGALLSYLFEELKPNKNNLTSSVNGWLKKIRNE
ncbi:hypothetical protein [Halobacillus litoralis]|uniref:Uncharacterized protein n=1 Tax=Halobacillus litoralis TaxID=45668 RepID=A0A410MJ49_9BACI|nr:hypothetical protein [Halobacillus litoralis]QAS54754.1 hypothetical protein HLI_21085 [Halobacillus litoralis]